jgi:hypothetical protein
LFSSTGGLAPGGSREKYFVSLVSCSNCCERFCYLHATKRKDLADVGTFAHIKPQTHDADNEWSNFQRTPGAEIYGPTSS